MKFITSSTTALLIASSGLAVAGNQTCSSDAILLQTTNWNDSVTIDKFDSALGVLVSVDFELTGAIAGSAAIESLDAQASTVTTNYQAAITLTRPDLSVLVVAVPIQNFVDNLTAFDATIDFGGTSGITHGNISVNELEIFNSTSAADIALFTGPAGAPGTIVLPVDAMGSSVASGSGNLITQFLTDAEASVTVCYNYDFDCNDNGIGDAVDVSGGGSNDNNNNGVPDECEPTIGSFCEGDGAAVGGGIECPCGNNGNPGEGCDNGTGFGGLLTGSGNPSISNDTVTVTASQIPNNAPGYFFGALTENASGNGTPFFSGIRCILNPVRLKKLNGGGTIPIQGGPSISSFLSLTPGDTVYIQYWYRNGTGPCIGQTVNATNGVEIVYGL